MAVKDKHLRRQPHQHTGNFVVVIPQQLVYRKRALQIFLSTFSSTTRSDEMPKRPTSKRFFFVELMASTKLRSNSVYVLGWRRAERLFAAAGVPHSPSAERETYF
jgi:hypothetical protein